jgi:hypothetical protein
MVFDPVVPKRNKTRALCNEKLTVRRRWRKHPANVPCGSAKISARSLDYNKANVLTHRNMRAHGT